MNQQAAMMASQQQRINQIQKNQKIIFQTETRGKIKESNVASRQKGSGQTAGKGRKQTECWNCEQLGHISGECPEKSQHKPTETIQTQSTPKPSHKSEVGENVNDCEITDHVEHSNEGEIDLEKKNLVETKTTADFETFNVDKKANDMLSTVAILNFNERKLIKR